MDDILIQPALFLQLPMMFDMTEAVDYRRIEETDTSPAGPLPLLEGFEIDYIPDIVAIICQIKYVHDASDMPRYAFTRLMTICGSFDFVALFQIRPRSLRLFQIPM